MTIPAFVLDTGALIALERAAPRMTALLLRVRDVHVAIIAGDRNAAVLTSDRDDLIQVDPDLADRIVDV